MRCMNEFPISFLARNPKPSKIHYFVPQEMDDSFLLTASGPGLCMGMTMLIASLPFLPLLARLPPTITKTSSEQAVHIPHQPFCAAVTMFAAPPLLLTSVHHCLATLASLLSSCAMCVSYFSQNTTALRLLSHRVSKHDWGTLSSGS